MIDIFDPHYDMKIKELIFIEYNRNKFISGQMFYVLGDDYNHHTILVWDFNTRLIMIKNNKLWIKGSKDMMKLPMICAMMYISHESYKELLFMWAWIDNIWYYHICPGMP